MLEYRENDGAASIQVCLRFCYFSVAVVAAAVIVAKVVGSTGNVVSLLPLRGFL